MSWTGTIESTPEKFGLKIIADVELGGAYEFDTFLLFKREGFENVLFFAHDAGCSCPIPFEDIGVDDLKEIRTVEGLRRAVRPLVYESARLGEFQTFFETARKALTTDPLDAWRSR